MTEEQIRQKIEQLEQERWELSMWTDSFNDSERKKYGELKNIPHFPLLIQNNFVSLHRS